MRFVTAPDGTHHLIAQGEQRFTVLDYVSREPFLVARIEAHKEPASVSEDIEARALTLRERAIEAVQLLPQAPAELGNAIRAIESPATLADIVASFMDLKIDGEAGNPRDLRPRGCASIACSHSSIGASRCSRCRARSMSARARRSMSGRKRRCCASGCVKFRKSSATRAIPVRRSRICSKAIADAAMPPEAEEQAQRELTRLERMPEGAAEYSMTRNYLDWLIAMPWSKLDPEQLDIDRARAILDEDHYGLEKVKRRILEFLAVRKLNPEGRSPILCFVGPPGVGKTSLGQSIAKALGLAVPAREPRRRTR